MSKKNYQNGKIYKLCNDVNDDIYVGSTTQQLSKRFWKHKSNATKYTERTVYKQLTEIGFDNVHIILIESYPCENKAELEKRERYWIDQLKPKLNKNVPTQTHKEYYDKHRGEILAWNKNDRILNNDKYKEKDKVYYETNKNDCKQRMKDYYQKNKAQLNIKRHEKHDCECGGKYITADKAKHFKTNKHQKYFAIDATE